MMPVTLDPRAAGPALPARGRRSWSGVRAFVGAQPWRPVLLSLLVARVVVLLAVLGVHLAALRYPGIHHLALLSWDASWYRRIAIFGYRQLPDEGVRFFPLLPVLARGLSYVVGSPGIALLVIANGSSVVFGLLLHRLALREGLGEAVARRAVWAAALVPAGFVNVMGYTEPLYGVLVCGLLLGCSRRHPPERHPGGRWWLVALCGALAGALRPPGVVLAWVVLVAALPGLRTAPARELAARAVAVAAPVAGLGAYLAWVGFAYGNPLLPYRAQTDATLRGGAFVNPLRGVVGAAQGLVHGRVQGAGVHVLWAAVALALLAVVVRRLPAPHSALTAVTVLLALTARSMTSFERYMGSTAPLLLGVAIIMSNNRLRRVTMTLAPLVLGTYATLAFLYLYVP